MLFVLVYILVLAPQKSSKRRIEKQLAEKMQMYNSALRATREETKLKSDEEIEYLRTKLGDFAIDSKGLSNLTFDISHIADEKKVDSFGIRTKDKRGSSAVLNCNYVCENHIDVSFTAGFNQFASFLNALERHRPVVFIDMFSIKRSRRADSGHEVNMDMAVFVKKQQDS